MVRSNKLRRKDRKIRRLTKKRKTRQSGGTVHTTTYPPDSITQYISNVVYINLDKRTDRRAQMEQELKVFHPEKVHRIPGIVPDVLDIPHKNVALTKAHLNAVNLAKKNNWPNTLILEDDSVWVNIEEAYPCFERLVKEPYDVIMLGSHSPDYDKDTLRVRRATSAASYLVHRSHYDVYIERLEALINSFVSGQHIECGNAVVFPELQEKYKWFVVVPSLMKQLAGRSNREGRHKNYTYLEVQPTS
jgi:hypothetical protein